MADDDPITVDYWELAYALGRALHDDEACFWAVVAELDKTFPCLGWHNAMTDGPATPPAVQDVFIDGMRFVQRVGHYTGHHVRMFPHPPIDEDRDIFLVISDQCVLIKMLNTVLITENEPIHFVTKDRNRP